MERELLPDLWGKFILCFRMPKAHSKWDTPGWWIALRYSFDNQNSCSKLGKMPILGHGPSQPGWMTFARISPGVVPRTYPDYVRMTTIRVADALHHSGFCHPHGLGCSFPC